MLTWDFEVWNEANLSVFWSASRDEWMKLYDVTAAAVKGVDPRLAVGGPSSAAAGWVDELLEHVQHSGSPVDFVTTHTYGNAPLDLRPTLERFGSTARIVWTEWGVTPTHFNPVNDSVSSATFLLHGMKSSAGRLDALSYWVASDHFEELGRPPRMLHGGFGLITVGGIAKSRYHALHLLSRLGETQLPVVADGDGADGLVQAWASRHDDGSLTVLLWNHTLDQDKTTGDPALARTVRLRLDGARRRRHRDGHPARRRPRRRRHPGRAARRRRLADRRAVGAAARGRPPRRRAGRARRAARPPCSTSPSPRRCCSGSAPRR